ncbi:cellobiose transport system substrate-binding protein [Thermomonospora echinospora]|uniref:Cellobiose transport system substrate-binding protein n=1 Tax=Thermomonospora echinospora TaxID=1992 RepID=A0A1H6E436_9ACTN|nr:extracellular solute-binding protein [Thermomonospora echinospora]SEG92081.1 cellobiose transport system substrate-binding protein [Thermomonospora echinospora]
MRRPHPRAPRRFRTISSLVTAAALALGAAACGGGGSESSNGTITLTVDTFSTFGYEELFARYEADHPGIKIKHRNVVQLDEYLPRLERWIAAGRGAGDVVALEEGILTKFMAQPDRFVNLLDHGAGSMQGGFLDWKWKQALTRDGKHLVGLGTDVGGLAMCYRTDLFAKAGLPTDREKVGALWRTWDDYIATGRRYTGKVKDAKFVDGAVNLYNSILAQQASQTVGHTYFDTGDKLVAGTNPAVRSAWDTTVKMQQAGLSAGLKSFEPSWGTGLKEARFATIACPSWMLGVIKENAGAQAAGKWDVAAIPGGAGSRGGSFLAVPKQSAHPKEAAELAKFLTGPDSQITAFKARNNLPSSPKALGDPAVTSFRNEYFSDAPVGEIYAGGAKALRPLYLGADNNPVGQRFEDALLALEQGKLAPDAAWRKALADAEREAR